MRPAQTAASVAAAAAGLPQHRGSIASSTATTTTTSTLVTKPDSVQLEGVTFMKMLRHAESLLSSNAAGVVAVSEEPTQRAEGKLVGLLVGSSLEVTNCFPSPALDHIEDAARRDTIENKYQMDMLSTMRMFKQDHVAVGWYTTASVASFATKAFVEHQFGYQQQHDESIVLVIDLNNLAKVKANPSAVLAPFTSPPCLVRAYRLSDAAVALYENNVFTPATMRQHGLSFENIFEQLPVTVHNSDLANILLHQFGSFSIRSLALKPGQTAKKDLVSVAATTAPSTTSQQQTTTALQRHLKDLALCAEELAVDAGRSVQNCVQQARYLQMRQQYVSRREAENRSKASRGEPVVPVTEDEIAHNVRTPATTNQLPALLLASQLSQTATESSRVAASVTQRNFATTLLLNGNNPSGSTTSTAPGAN